MTSSKNFSALAQLGRNATVTTPSGKTARVVSLHPVEGEATVQWPGPDCERGRFKVMNLRPADNEGST